MLFRGQLGDQFEKRADDLRTFARRESQEAISFQKALDRIASLGRNAFDENRIKEGNIGAVPDDEFFENGSIDSRFGVSWRNHEAAREWTQTILSGRVTFAADGSQIYSGNETSIPVAAVQIGWFENPHDSTKPYEKGSVVKLLTPEDLIRDQEEPMNADIRVEEQRYLGEVEKLTTFLKKARGWSERGERMPLAFFDNPLLVPFSQKGLQKSLVKATVDLVQTSMECRVPVVGYIDRSFARDIVTLLQSVVGEVAPSDLALFDGSFLNTRLPDGRRLLEHWGDRTTYFHSFRRGLDSFVDKGTGSTSVGFVYLRTSSTGPPARVDLPVWVCRGGLLSEVIDVVRAECVIGLGYPYALESADQTAVISSRDRESFFGALQRFAKREKLEFGVSRKDASKRRRR